MMAHRYRHIFTANIAAHTTNVTPPPTKVVTTACRSNRPCASI